MPAPETPGSPDEDEDDEELAAGGRCPICEMLAGECDHLVVSIDLNFSEFIAGAMFAQERAVLDLLEHLASSDPDALKVAGAGPVLEQVATLVKDETEEGASTGDALAIFHPQILAALSHLLQEEEDVTATSVEAASGNDVQNLWALDPEWIVEQMIERLQSLVHEVDEEEGRDER